VPERRGDKPQLTEDRAIQPGTSMMAGVIAGQQAEAERLACGRAGAGYRRRPGVLAKRKYRHRPAVDSRELHHIAVVARRLPRCP
jgi:hypothetical protein